MLDTLTETVCGEPSDDCLISPSSNGKAVHVSPSQVMSSLFRTSFKTVLSPSFNCASSRISHAPSSESLFFAVAIADASVSDIS